jgi:phosphatidylglycerophosphate synthase
MQPSSSSYYFINAITMYRLVSAPFLLLLVAMGQHEWFKWLIAFSFFTDAIDGPLSRKYKVTSIFGSRLDSVADDATVLVSTIALWIIQPHFFLENWMIVAGLLALFGIQTVAALIAYKKVTSFHTYLAKTAAVAQAGFFISAFFGFQFSQWLFVLATLITAAQLIEEIVLVILLPEWKTDVKGLYWVLRSRNGIIHSK